MRFIMPLLLLALSLPASASPDKTTSPHGFVYVITDDGVAYGYRVLPNGALAPLKTLPTQIKPFVRTPEPDYPEQPPITPSSPRILSISRDGRHPLTHFMRFSTSQAIMRR